MKKTGFLVAIASPSGGGKSTICREILRMNNSFTYSISWTTRPIRGEEVDGKDYFFTDVDDFKKKIKANYFLEHAVVHGNYYGTSKEYINQRIADELVVLLDIDVQGVQLLKKQDYPIVSIFVLPPDIDVLRHRLKSRKTDTKDVIQTRMPNALKEIEYIGDYDYLVINDDLKKAVTDVDSILTAEMNHMSRYVNPKSEFLKK